MFNFPAHMKWNLPIGRLLLLLGHLGSRLRCLLLGFLRLFRLFRLRVLRSLGPLLLLAQCSIGAGAARLSAVGIPL